MLGYRGRSNRREFIGAAALLSLGPMAFSMLLIPAIPALMGGGSRDAVLLIGLLLTALVCGVVAVWFWGWTALVTRRARDIGWPAWSGVAATAAVMVLASLTTTAALFAWIGVMAVLRSGAARRGATNKADVFA